MVAEFVDLEGYLYCALVCKHPQLWYPLWVLEPVPHGYQGTGLSFRAVLSVSQLNVTVSNRRQSAVKTHC